MLQLAKWIARAGFAMVVLSGAATAHGQTVTFDEIKDAVPGRFFDAATTVPDAANPNQLHIGLHTGLDFKTYKYTDFRASSTAFSHTTAMDTISFRIIAPEGYYIARVTYSQRGTGLVLRTGRAAGTTNWVVAKNVADLGAFATNPTLSDTIDLSASRLTEVPVSITNSLFAFSTPLLGSATVSLSGADVIVELLPLEAGSN
jgi:hypothetical protein